LPPTHPAIRTTRSLCVLASLAARFSGQRSSCRMSAARPCTRFTSSVMKSMTSTPVTRRVNQEGPDQQDFRMRAFRNVPVLLQKACVGAPTLMGLVARLASPRTTLAPLYHRRALHDRRHQGDGRARARGGRRADSGFRPRKPDALVRRGVGAPERPRLMGTVAPAISDPGRPGRFRDVMEIPGFPGAVPKIRVHLPPARSLL